MVFITRKKTKDMVQLRKKEMWSGGTNEGVDQGGSNRPAAEDGQEATGKREQKAYL